jgi:small subunit ribosomal protein S4
LARYRESVCRLCRREGLKLFLKGDRCYTDKCAIERRNYPPGQHGQGRRKVSDYAHQLREKQKIKRIYRLQEKQFHKFFVRAERKKGITGKTLLLLLERRLDNIVYRLGFACSRNEARLLTAHGHFFVNGKSVNIPSYLVNVNDVIELSPESKKITRIQESLETAVRRGIPNWLELDKENMKGKVKAFPTREELTMPMEEQLVVELYSK